MKSFIVEENAKHFEWNLEIARGSVYVVCISFIVIHKQEKEKVTTINV
jgi:hypothetical protein